MAFDPISLAVQVGIQLITTSISARANRQKVNQFTGIPTIDQGRSIPEIVGTVELDAPAMIDFGDFKTSSVRTEFPTWLNILMPITAILDQLPFGYRYYIGLDFGLCHGPDVTLTHIKVQNKKVWEGLSTGGTITVQAPSAFGAEGGLYAVCDFYPGSMTQTANAYWKARHSDYVPGYHGTSHLVWRGPSSLDPPLGKIKYSGYVGRSANLKPFKFGLRRIPNNLSQPAYTLVNGKEGNPVEYIYEKFTDEAVGMGFPSASMDIPAFQVAAQTVFNEGLGLCQKWDTPVEYGERIQEVIDLIDCTVYSSIIGPNAGKITIKLIRDDYVIADLPVITVSNATKVLRYGTRTPEDLPNNLKAKFVDINNNFVEAMVNFFSHAVRRIRNEPTPLELRYPVGTNTTAVKLITRDGIALAIPLKDLTISTNREAWNFQPGDVFKLVWTEYGITQQIYRVVKPNFGSLDNPEITLECVEDRFRIGASSYAVNLTAPTVVTPPTTNQEGATHEIKNRTTSAPPASPVVGDSYVIAAGASGVWTAKEGHLATWNGSAWVYESGADLQNKTVFNEATGGVEFNNGLTWEAFSSFTVEEQDGAPSIPNVTKIKFPNSTVTDESDGVVSVSSSGHVIQNEGTSLTPRSKLNFVGDYFAAIDDAVNDQTDVIFDSAALLADAAGSGGGVELTTAAPPTDTPTIVGGKLPAKYNTTNRRLYIYNNASLLWDYFALTPAPTPDTRLDFGAPSSGVAFSDSNRRITSNAGDAWNTHYARASVQLVGNGFFRTTVQQLGIDAVWGFKTASGTGSFSTINFEARLYGNQNLARSENGINEAGVAGTYAIGDMFQLRRNGNVITMERHNANGTDTLLYTFATSCPLTDLYLCVDIYTGSKIMDGFYIGS